MEYIDKIFLQANNYYSYLAVISCIYLFLRKYLNGPKCIVNSNDLNEKIVIITGANAGIGLETAKLIIKRGAIVIFACRDEKRTLDIIKKLDNSLRDKAVFIKCDVSSIASINEFVDSFSKKFLNFDILINNAGAMFNKFEFVKDGPEMNLSTNYLGGLFLSLILLNKINRKGRIINVNSYILRKYKFNFEDLKNDLSFEKLKENYNFINQYCLSKQCQYVFSKFLNSLSMQKKFENLNFKSVCLHPGVILTDAQFKFKGFFMNLMVFISIPIFYILSKSVFYGSQTTLHTVLEKFSRLKDGGYYSDCSIKSLPEFLDDDKYNKEILNYTYLLIKKFYDMSLFSDNVRESIELMKN